MIAPNPRQPLTFDDARRTAEANHAGRRRMSFRWRNQTYYRCSHPECREWKAAGQFSPIKSKRSVCGRNSYCRTCAARAVRLSKAKAEARRCEYAMPTPPPVRPRVSSGWKFGDRFADTADSIGTIAPDVPVPGDLNPRRLGRTPPAMLDVEHERWRVANRINPALTWDGWRAVIAARKPRGRRPKGGRVAEGER